MLKVEIHPEKGRCFTVTEAVSAGTTLLVAKSYSSIPDSESKRRVCANCLKWSSIVSPAHNEENSRPPFLHYTCYSTYSNVEAIPTSRQVSLNELFFQSTPVNSSNAFGNAAIRVAPPCNHVFYCSLECAKNDWIEFHAIECSFLRQLFKGIPPPIDSISEIRNSENFDNYTLDYLWNIIRIIIRRAKELTTNPLDNTLSFNDVWNICDNMNSFPNEKIQIIKKVATCLLRFMEDHLSVSFPGLSMQSLLPHLSNGSKLAQENVFESLVSLICREECNSFGLYTFKYLGSTYPRQSYALSLFPKAVFFNHSCLPNVGHSTIVTSEGIDLAFYSLKDLKKGDEAVISYLALENDVQKSTKERQRELREHFYFDCKCVRCTNGDDQTDILSTLQSQLCKVKNCFGRYAPEFLNNFKRNDSAKLIVPGTETQNLQKWICEACGDNRE